MYKLAKLCVLAAVAALTSIGAATAAAAEFTFSTEGELQVKSNETQVFTALGGTTSCKKLSITGTPPLAGTTLHTTAHYSECQGIFNSPVHITNATYALTANGQVHIKNTITIVSTTFIGTCHFTIEPQTVGTFSHTNNADGTVTLTPHINSMIYTSSGFPCGASGTTGTFTGNVTIGVIGGILQVDT